MSTPKSDVSEISRALRLILEPGQVTELRALDAVSANERRPHVESGYFDDPEKLCRAAAQISARGIYFVPNSVKQSLLSRAANRIRSVGREPTTSDHDIIKRHWLLIDCDPVRPAGISSSEAEHAAALVRAKTMRAALQAEGWPQPILADSGNGAHLPYRIDLPVDDSGRIQQCLAALAARFDDAAVHIDKTVFNPARIWKLYGTPSCKGDHTPERPHRLSRIIEAPDGLDIVPVELLEKLAATAPQPEGPNRSGHSFDIDCWISDHRLDVRGPEPWKGGRRWVFPVCPWNPEHTDRSAFIVELRGGAIGAGCQHNGCSGKDWHALRDVAEPGWRERRQQPRTTSESTTTPRPWPEIEPFAARLPAFPVETLPPVLRDWVHAESIATQTPPDLAALLSLAVVATTIQREVIVEARQGWIEPTSLYVVSALPSGNRKSAVFADVTRPLRDHETALIARARDVVALAESELRQQRRALEAAEKTAAKGSASAAAQVREMAIELARAEAEAPHHPVLIVDDATPEALAVELQQQRGRLASMSAEGGVFDIIAGLYTKSGKTANLNVYLQAHAGELFTQHRIGRPSIRVERAALTCAYAVQPSVIAGIAENLTLRSRGVLARYFYSIPTSWVGHRDTSPPPVPEAISGAYHRAVLDLAEDVARWSERGEGKPWRLRLASDASDLLDAWMIEIEAMLRDGEPLEMMRDWGGKLAGQTLRLAAAMHCIRHGLTGQISADTLTAAIRIGRWAVPHADHALRLMAASDGHTVGDAEYLLRWITERRLDRFTRRDAHRHGSRRWPRVEDVEPALAELVRRGYIRRIATTEPAGTGRPPSPVYEVHPDAQDQSVRADRTDTIPTSDGDEPSFVSSVSSSDTCEADAQPGCPDDEQAPIPDCPEAEGITADADDWGIE